MVEGHRRAAVILNAGRSSRMGRAKSDLPFPLSTGHITFLERAISLASRTVSKSEIRVVVSNFLELADNKISQVLNPQPERGMFSSLQVGLKDLFEKKGVSSWTAILMVDYPLVSHQTVEQLFSQETSGHDVIVPTCGLQSGHPVLLSPGLAQRCLEAPPEARLDALIKTCRTRQVAVNDPGISRNINTPSLYQWYFGPLPHLTGHLE